MNDDFGIGGRLKDGPRVFQLFAQYFSVDQIAVMRDCDGPLRVFDDKRLNIFQMTLAGRRVTIVTDCPRALQSLDNVLVEDIRNQTHLPMGNKSLSIRRNNAARFLASVLERIKS